MALLAIALVAALLVQRSFLLGQVEADVEENLNQEAAELRQLVGGIDPETGEPFSGDVVSIFDTFLARNVPLEGEALLTYVSGDVYKTNVAGSQLAEIPRATAWGMAEASERGSFEDPTLGAIRYLVVPLVASEGDTGTFVVAMQMDDRLDRVDDAVRLGALTYGSIFILASALAWVAAGVVLRPLRELAETAQSIEATEDLSRRIEVEGDDEIAELGRTFNSMLDRLDEVFESQSRFIDDAGHELRTPITVIRGNLEVMGDDPIERRETIRLVTDELDRMGRIVDDLLDLANVEQPEFVQAAPFDLAEFTRELVSRAEALDEREWIVEHEEHAVVVADRHRLNQAMMNLISNAADYSRRDSPVWLGSQIYDGNIRLSVRDSGPPIPEDQRERIFERFARAETERRRTKGAGLGLSIVRAIAEAHGGTVKLESNDDGGNVFTIELPVELPGEDRS